MKNKLCVLLGFIGITCSTSFSAFADQGRYYSNQDQGRMFAGATVRSESYPFEASAASHIEGAKWNITCYFKSELAGAINGASWSQNVSETPACDGLTQEQLLSLDFNNIKMPGWPSLSMLGTADYAALSKILEIQASQEKTEIKPHQEKMFVGRWIGADDHIWQLPSVVSENSTHSFDTKAATCVYNSHLVAQIHKAYEEQSRIDHSTCEGLTQEQVSTIDFSKLDVTAFISSMSNATPNN